MSRPTRTIPLRTRLALASVLALAWASAVPAGLVTAAGEPADAVLDWNVNATTAIVAVAKQPPAAAILSYAMVQGAVYDAINAIDGGHELYLVAPAASGTESKAAAAATAAHDVLVGLFPAQTAQLDAQLAASLVAVPDGTAKTDGVAVGQSTAAAMIAARTNDGRFGPSVVTIGTQPGEWRPAPPASASDPVSWVANVKPFLLSRGDLFRSDGPNTLTSAAYAEDLNEVRSLGSVTSTTRTADQTDAAIWWQDHGTALWNRILRNLIVGQGLGIVDAARLLAMTNLAGADALISCWNDKYFWNFWRPITAIREADTDGNPATIADPTWAPLIATPPFPAHPSGHSCVSSAIVNTLQAFFGTDKVAFSAFSNNSHSTRSFTHFSGALKEVLAARIWGGIHFRTDDVQGSVIGVKVAHYLLRHYFAPIE
jgi:PAP2 superfamily protein